MLLLSVRGQRSLGSPPAGEVTAGTRVITWSPKRRVASHAERNQPLVRAILGQRNEFLRTQEARSADLAVRRPMKMRLVRGFGAYPAHGRCRARGPFPEMTCSCR